MNTQSSDEWLQDYQENMASLPELNFDVTSTAAASPSSPKVSSLSGKGSVRKPVRRRSRASKKTPTTLLNADANNFRALVQQFTGCNSGPPPLGAYKGPINLNFAQYKYTCEKKPDRSLQPWQQNIEHRREGSDQSLLSFGTDDIAASSDHDQEMFLSTVDDDPRPDQCPLTLDDFDVENFPSQDLSGPGEYSGTLPGTRNDDFWGY